ncbi:serine hydrolase domain-containing protein [Haloferula chungangensis]|uniref:Serine hydrolase domain-containing protein n=1 Tax=Haloferula chungangensis TaxID=1048331 RepID=A0ABW2L563_9BACT
MGASEFETVVQSFEENFRTRGEIGASVSIWWKGEEILSLGKGWCEKGEKRAWTKDTLVPVYSATKPLAAATLLLALEKRGLGVETMVREVWPAFPVEEASFGDLLSHQCGLSALDQAASIWEHDEVVAAIEAQVPAWRPGQGHGYHARTFGTLVDEPVRRLTGKVLGQLWWEEIAQPMGLEFWIGLPESEWARVAELYPGKASAGDFASGFYHEFNREGSLTRRTFGSPRGLRSVQEMNDPKAWAAGFPASGGVGTATALAKFYQAAIGAIESPLSESVRKALATRRVEGDDQVLIQPTAFSAGCQLDPVDADGTKERELYGPDAEAFGHPGAGGSHAFGDPELGLSFAYTMNQMELNVMPGRRSTTLVDALFGKL